MTLVISLVLLFSYTKVWAQNVSGTISRVGDATHLEFRGNKEWKYESPKKEKNKIAIILPAFDDATVAQLQAWSCPLIKKIAVSKNAPDGQYDITLYLSSDEVESFDYLTDDPSYLIFDFYKQAHVKPGVKGADLGDIPKKNKLNPAAQKKAKTKRSSVSGEYKKINRSPAGDEIIKVENIGQDAQVAEESEGLNNLQLARGVYDGADTNYDRLRVKDYQISEEAIIASRQNVYIPFPILAQKLNRFEELVKLPPIYEIIAEENLENKEARFLVTMFEKRREGALFETIGYFEKKYPSTKYDEIIKNIKAEAYIQRYLKTGELKDYNEFRSIYRYLVEKYPDSVLTERNMLLLAYSGLDKDKGTETLQDLQKYILRYPNSSEKDKIRLAIGEIYAALKKPEDANKTYDEIINDPQDKAYGIEAAYRIGDVYFEQNKYEKALEAYKDVQQKYPAFRKIFANAQYNLSESQFWLGQYKDSLNSYIDFIQMFPVNKHGGFALTRIGELLEILGVDQRQFMGVYIESYFRFPDSPGSEVARIRMLSRGLKGMKDGEKKHALTEIDEISKKSNLPQIKEFTTILKSEGLARRGEFRNALDILITFYQQNPSTQNLKIIKSRTLRNISDVLKEETSKKNYIEALNFFGKYSTTWLKNSGRIDTQYYQALALEQAGVTKEAKKIYLKIYDQLKSIAGSNEEKERIVYENLPRLAQINLRLAATALEEKQYQEANKYLSQINEKLSEAEDIERVQIGAAVSEQTGDIKRAIAYLEKLNDNLLKNEKLIVKPELSLARLYLKQNKNAEADQHLSRIEKMTENKVELTDNEMSELLKLRGDLQLQSGQKIAAVETYMKLLDAYESKYPMSSIRYKAGKILFEEGDIRGAEKIWGALDDNTGALYKRLSSERLSQAKWQDNYKKYINRIPAAKELK